MRLNQELSAQAGWLVADRIGLTNGPMPAFDPSGLLSRDRWQAAVDVRRSVGQVLSAVSFALGVELTRSPLPRHDLVDDRTGPRRPPQLSCAGGYLRALPLGVWVDAGPYTRAEWLAWEWPEQRESVPSSGSTSPAIPSLCTSRGLERCGDWRRPATVLILVLSEKVSPIRSARRRRRYATCSPIDSLTPLAGSTLRLPGVCCRAHSVWAALPDGRDDRTQHRSFDDRV